MDQARGHFVKTVVTEPFGQQNHCDLELGISLDSIYSMQYVHHHTIGLTITASHLKHWVSKSNIHIKIN